MNRRSFLRAAAIAPAIAAMPAISSAPAGYERVSCEKGDPGERAYALACAGGKTVKVYLDGVEQKYALTADTNQGWVKRTVVSADGNIAFNRATEEIYTEIVHGAVRIEVI
jgi:hypothetical protein